MIKKIIINAILLVIITVLIYSKYINIIAIKGVTPDIFFLLIFFNGIFINPTFGMIFGFFSGLAKDIFTFGIIGFNSMIYLIIGYLTLLPKKIIEIDNTITSSIVVTIFFIIKILLYLIIGAIFIDFKQISVYFKNVFFIELIYTLGLSIPIFLIYRKIFKSRKKDYSQYE